MAKFKPGPAVGELSGSIGCLTFSHNRYGTYMRSRVIPVNVDSTAQRRTRGYLATASSAWRSLTSAQRLTWKQFAALNPIIDKLGQSQVLSANAAYTQLASRQLLDSHALPTTAPIVDSPTGLSSLTMTGDIGSGSFGVIFTTTPLATGLKLYLRATVVNSASITFIKNTLKWIGFTAAAQASPFDCQAQIEAIFGTLAIGQIVFVTASVYDPATGLLSLPLRTSVVVSSTP